MLVLLNIFCYGDELYIFCYFKCRIFKRFVLNIIINVLFCIEILKLF